MPKLSIVTVNFNDSIGLEKTIISVRNQTFRDYEHIVIDAGSTDGSYEIIQKYKDGIAKWVSEPDGGIYDGMNKGIQMASGEFIHFLNSGDWLVDESVYSKVSNQLQNKSVYYGNQIKVQIDNSKKKLQLAEKIDFRFMHESCVPHSSSFIPRTYFEQYGLYDVSYKIVGDYDFWLKLYRNQEPFIFFQIDVSYFNCNGISSQENNLLHAWERKKSKLRNFTFFQILKSSIFSFLIRLKIIPRKYK